MGLRQQRHDRRDDGERRRTRTPRLARSRPSSPSPTVRPTASRTLTVNVLEPDDPGARFRVLVFSKTAGFRHSSIDEGHAAIEQLGDAATTSRSTTPRTRPRSARTCSRHYDSVVWLSTTGDVLNAAQQTAFENYIKAGGGYTGIHSAADTEYEWKWYGRLVGAYFLSHPTGTSPQGGRDATVIVEDTDGPLHAGPPDTRMEPERRVVQLQAGQLRGDRQRGLQPARERRPRPGSARRVDVRARSDGNDDG